MEGSQTRRSLVRFDPIWAGSPTIRQRLAQDSRLSYVLRKKGKPVTSENRVAIDLSDGSYMDEGFYIPERYYWSTGLESGLASTLRMGKEPQMIQGVLSAIKREGIEI